jgi:hypothetical protein
MSTSNKIFFLIAVFTVSTLTLNFVNNGLNFHSGGVLGDSDLEDSLDFDLDDLDSFLDEELEYELDEINLDDLEETNALDSTSDDFMEVTDAKDEIEAAIEEVELEFEIATQPTTTKTTSKIQKLFLLVPVEIKTTQVLSKSGKLIEEKQTVLGRLLDIFSF